MMRVYYWNLVDPLFNTLQPLFRGQYETMWNASDAIGRQILTLNQPVIGRLEDRNNILSLSLPAVPGSAHLMVDNLQLAHQHVLTVVDAARQVANDLEDRASTRLLVERQMYHGEALAQLRRLIGATRH